MQRSKKPERKKPLTARQIQTVLPSLDRLGAPSRAHTASLNSGTAQRNVNH